MRTVVITPQAAKRFFWHALGLSFWSVCAVFLIWLLGSSGDSGAGMVVGALINTMLRTWYVLFGCVLAFGWGMYRDARLGKPLLSTLYKWLTIAAAAEVSLISAMFLISTTFAFFG